MVNQIRKFWNHFYEDLETLVSLSRLMPDTRTSPQGNRTKHDLFPVAADNQQAFNSQ